MSITVIYRAHVEFDDMSEDIDQQRMELIEKRVKTFCELLNPRLKPVIEAVSATNDASVLVDCPDLDTALHVEKEIRDLLRGMRMTITE